MTNQPAPLRLYQIVDTTKNTPIQGVYFVSKVAAKKTRTKMNEDESGSKLRYIVSPGPDHKRYQRSTTK